MAAVSTIILFLIGSLGAAMAWNEWLRPVPPRVTLLFVLIVSFYQAPTLFTSRTDFPANISAIVYPWKAEQHERADANTGIIPTQIAPWTRAAVRAIQSGEWPLWNRHSGSGTPLLANQQTAIFHPLTLVSFFLLPTGKAFTLTASLRLFFLLFATFCFARSLRLSASASIFAAVAYTFCTFHIIWLLFPLGLATMMLPLALVGAQYVREDGKVRSALVLTTGLALAVLGGHPESAFWVWVTTAAYTLFVGKVRLKPLALAGLSFAAAAALTAFFWLPTVELLPHLSRSAAMRSPTQNPTDHGLGRDWVELLVAPNVLGTPQTGTWTGPAKRHPLVLDDYGEIASGYAGAVPLSLALAGLFGARRRKVWFFAALIGFAAMTVSETPVWRDLVRLIPIAGLTLTQRLRILVALGTVMLAAFALQDQVNDRKAAIAAGAVGLAIVAIYIDQSPSSMAAWTSFAITLLVLAAFIVLPKTAAAATVLAFVELVAVTFRYNPSSRPEDVMPETPAIEFMSRTRSAERVAAIGWSFLPDTPGYFGLEDVKTTDPIRHQQYTWLLEGFLHVQPSYDQIIGSVDRPFFDMLGTRYVYVPPGAQLTTNRRFEKVYSGNDGSVFANPHALPRYFIVRRFSSRPDFHQAIRALDGITDFRSDAIVHHVPDKVIAAAPHMLPPNDDLWIQTPGGTATIKQYRNNGTVLEVETTDWGLLASSDTNWAGWRAYINDVRQPPVTVNGVFLGLFVPPGRNRVEFVYRPLGFERGLRISAVALVLILCLIAVQARQRATQHETDANGRQSI